MKLNKLSIVFTIIFIFLNIYLSAQNCPEVQDKSIILQGPVNGPCAIYTARDNVTLMNGFTLKGGPKKVDFKWNSNVGGYTPQLKIGNFPICSGLPLPTNYTMADLNNSFTALKSNLSATLGAGYTVDLFICGLNCASIQIENLSDFTYSGNYSIVTIIKTYQPLNTSFTAKIDNNLLFPVTYLDGSTIPDLTTRQPNTDLHFGTIEGNIDVSPTGAATYEIPITVPKGLGNLEPKISIVYNSQSGNGLIGWGCNLTGISTITRVSQNKYSDNAIKGLKYDSDDRFALDGNRLVLANAGDIYGANNTTYRTENETFLHIISHGTYYANSPIWFEVFDKAGTKYKYGSQTGRTLYTDGSNNTVLKWFLDYVEDKFGNTITYTYESSLDGMATYLKTITYGTNNSGVGLTSTVNFYYEIRQDPIPIHYFTLNSSIDRVLNKVITKTGDQIFRTYELAYTKDFFTRLTKLTEKNGEGAEINPTYFKWGDYQSISINQTSYNLPTDIYYSQVNFSQRNWTSGDVNGDGVTDLISFFPYLQPPYGLKINIAQPFLSSISDNGTVSFTLGTVYNFLSGTTWDNFAVYSTLYCTQNYNGDSEPDIIVPILYKSTGGGTGRKIQFLALNQDPLNPILEHSLIDNSESLPVMDIGDLNNDGIADIIFSEFDITNSLNKLYIHYGISNPEWTNLPENNWTGPYSWTSTQIKNIFIGDYNNDGLNDVMSVNVHGEFEILQNANGTIGIFPYPIHSSFFLTNCGIIRKGDFNGDGLIDFITNEQDTPNWYFALSHGNFTFEKIDLPLITAKGQDFTDKDASVDNCIVTDFNNDGKSDVIVFDGTYDKHCDLFGCWGEFNNFKTFWYRSTGNNVIQQAMAYSTNSSDATYSRYISGDFNGDGRQDLMNLGYDCYGATQMDEKFRSYTTSNNNYEGGMVTSISNGLAFNTTISYITTAVNGSTVYSIDPALPSGIPTYPLSFLENPIYVVKSLTYPNGVASNNVLNFTYKNGIVDLQRGFLGFGKFTSTSTLLNSSNEKNFEFKYTLINTSGTIDYYQPFLTSTISKVGTTITSETNIPLNTYSVNPITGIARHVFIYPTQTTQTDFLKKIKITSTSSLDNDGNILTSKNEITDKDNTSLIVSSQQLTYNGYAKRDITINPNPFKNAPDNIVSEEVHKDTPGVKFTVTTGFNYNTNGTVQNKTDFSGTSKSLLTSYNYDLVGNNYSITVGDRTNSVEYTSDKRFVKKRFDALYNDTDPNLQHYTETDYDIWGNPTKKWDMNRLMTSYQYDNWGQIINILSPDGLKLISSIDWYDKGNASTYKHPSTLFYSSSFDEDNHLLKAEYFDAVGHSLRIAEGGFNGRILLSDATYTTKGQLYTQSNPYPNGSTPSKITSFSYDDFGRTNLQTLTNGETITTTYSDDNLRKITKTYSTGEVYIKEYDAAGLLTKASDPGGNITYTYYSNSKPKNIQPYGGAGATQITYYTETGLQQTLSDPNTGSKTNTYTYNSYGELETQTDANSKTTTVTYDKVGRIKTKTIGENITTYNYDETGATGLLKNICSNGIPSLTYKYDNLERIIEESSCKQSDVFTFKYEYDTKSRVSKVTYPNNMMLTYGYNNLSGNLTSVLKDGSVIWSLGTTTNDVNSIGQILKVTLGNGKSTFYGYDTDDRLNSITASNVINFSYLFNNKQQLENRDEKLFNGTTMVGFKENFTYDAVNRLLTATKDNGNTPLTMTYKTGVNDRIETKSDAGTFNYPDITKYCIDNITNLTSTFPNHDLTYNDEGKTTQISETNSGVNKTLTINYGPDGNRFKTEYYQNSTRKYTRYYFNNYEKEVLSDNTIRHLNYIYVAGNLIAIFEQKSGGDKMHYVYTDYLGSLRCITSENGTIEQQMSYDAWGGRRDYLTGLKLTDSQVVSATALTSRGFTGQEHLDGLGLINLNARLYEPGLGVFLSPDNYIQAPDNSQNFNRYTYCVNNPLKYTDPDGNIFGLVIAAWLLFTESGYEVQKYVLPVAVHVDLHLGSEQKAIGIDASVGIPKAVPISYRVHGGATYYWGHYDGSYTGWETRHGGEWTLGGVISYSGTTFSSGGTSQTTGMFTIGGPFVNLKYENDMMFGFKLPGVPEADGGDRYRTAAARLKVGPFQVGLNLFTGDPGLNGADRKINLEEGGKYGLYEENANGDNPNKYRAGVVYFGFGPFKFGRNSEANRNFIQNEVIHDNVSKSPYFLKLDRSSSWFWYFGTGTGNTLW